MSPELPQLDVSLPAWPADWLEKVDTCLWCGGKACAPLVDGVRDWFFAAVPGEFSFARCDGCASLLLQERPVEARIALAYRGYYTHSERAGADTSDTIPRRFWRACATGYARQRFGGSRALRDRAAGALVDLMPFRRAVIDAQFRNLAPQGLDILDYGCGNGDFLALAESLGNRAIGLDFDADTIALARRRKLSVYQSDEAPFDQFPQRFDLITAVHVLEHLSNPLILINNFRSWLKPGGRLFVELPGGEAAGLAQHGRFWRGLEAPRHFSIPSERGLREVLEKSGFEIVQISKREYGRHFMDTASESAEKSQPHIASGAPLAVELNGAEIITCLARAI